MTLRPYSQLLCIAGLIFLFFLGRFIPESPELAADQVSHNDCADCGLSGSGLPCICIQYPMFYNGMYYLYYAHRHEDCGNCSVFDPCVYASASVLSAQDCQLGECPQGSAEFTDVSLHLDRPLSADFDLMEQMISGAKCSLKGIETGTVVTPSRRVARIKVFHLSCFSDKSAEPESISLGFEIEDDGRPLAFKSVEGRAHESYEHVYEAVVRDRTLTVFTSP